MFDGLRVLELASVLAGPSVGQFFAELGAEVIKIENPATGGDVTRSWKSSGESTDDRSAYFCCCNWGKKSVCLDLRNADEQATLHRLVARADIVLSSFKSGDDKKLGVDYATLSALNPKLICGQITGYGPLDDRVGYDAVIQAESGFMSMNGEPDGAPLKMPVALVDVLAAHHLKEGLLLALMSRSQDGRGRLVSVSLWDAAVASLANQATNFLVGGAVARPTGSAHPNIAPYGDSYATSDGKRILLAVGTDRQFSDLCRVVGLEVRREWSDNAGRVRNRSALSESLAGQISNLGSSELMDQFRACKVPAGMIMNVGEVFAIPGIEGLVLDSGSLRGPRQWVADGFGRAMRLSPPPHLGEHTEEVLNRL